VKGNNKCVALAKPGCRCLSYMSLWLLLKAGGGQAEL